jgi:hypothetical protein
MDIFSHRVYIEAQRTKDDRHIASSLMRCLKSMGMRDFLQLDNELSFRETTDILDPLAWC